MKTCLACMTTYSFDETCPACECPLTDEEFDDPTGEQQDSALRQWFDDINDLRGLREFDD